MSKEKTFTQTILLKITQSKKITKADFDDIEAVLEGVGFTEAKVLGTAAVTDER